MAASPTRRRSLRNSSAALVAPVAQCVPLGGDDGTAAQQLAVSDLR